MTAHTRGARPVARTSLRTAGSAALALLVAAPVARAQSELETTIRQYGAATVAGYMQPLADVLVSSLSSGFHNGASLSTGFTFGFELVGNLAALDDKLRSFTASAPPGFQPSTFQTPTIFGGQATPITYNGQTFQPPDGLMNEDFFPSAVPQLRVGLLGTEVVGRYFTSSIANTVPREDFPKLELLGVGLRTSLNRFLGGMLPFELSVGASYNSLTFGDIVDFKSNSLGVQIGKSFGLFGLYGGLASDGGTMDVTYTSSDPQLPGTIKVNLDVSRTMRFTGGSSLRLGGFRLFADANLGDLTTYSFGFRIAS